MLPHAEDGALQLISPSVTPSQHATRASDPFLDAQVWGTPTIGPGTVIDARSSSLRERVDFWTSPGMRGPPIEHVELSRQAGAFSGHARRRLAGNAEILCSGSAPYAPGAPLIRNWNFGFPPGAMTVEIVGETGIGRNRRSIAEPLVAVDTLRRFALT